LYHKRQGKIELQSRNSGLAIPSQITVYILAYLQALN